MGVRTGDGPGAVSREEVQHELTNTPHLHPDEPGGIRPAEREKQGCRVIRQRMTDERAGAKPPHALPGERDESGHRLCG